MKIGIVTVSYSENYGSVLQAFALKSVLENLGHDVVFISTRNRFSSHSIKHTFLSSLKSILHGSFRNALVMIQRYQSFEKTLQNFEYITIKNCSNHAIDLLIVGSDTVWDINSKYFRESRRVFWPENTNCRVISYAASAANTTAAQLSELRFPSASLRGMSAISVRDQYTQNLVFELTGQPADISCDPTLLLNAEAYNVFRIPVQKKPFIAVYLFGSLPSLQIEAIRKYAVENNLQLVSIGRNLNWCDKNAPPSLESFVSYMAEAKFVVTDTFHGTVFSIIFEQHFISFGFSKQKVINLLDELSLSDRLCSPDTDISSIMPRDINYCTIRDKIDLMRQNSLLYLQDNLLSGSDL